MNQTNNRPDAPSGFRPALAELPPEIARAVEAHERKLADAVAAGRLTAAGADDLRRERDRAITQRNAEKINA